MRLTGSFQTIVTQGVSGTTTSSASGRSTSAGAVLTGSSPPRPLPLVSPINAGPVARHASGPPGRGRPAAIHGAGGGARTSLSLPFVTDPGAGGQATGA